LARRARNTDPALADLHAEIEERIPPAPLIPPRDEKRSAPRMAVDHAARLASADLVLEGRVVDVGQGGVFLATNLLIEVGERGTLKLVQDGEPSAAGVPVRVVWLRGASHPHGPGMGLAFEIPDKVIERRALELLLEVLDESIRK
jgi:hypothetical protein